MCTFNAKTVWTLLLSILISTQAHAQSNQLDLRRAEILAIERDALLQMKRAESKALLERSVAADTLPDPRVSLGLVNYPTDTFERDQEPMTQTRVAIQQMFPRGDSLALKSQQTLKSSELSNAAALNRERMVLMQVRSVYLELLYWHQAQDVVEQNKKLFSKLVKITESQYASGIQRQQDVIRAELELDMLDDRMDMIKTKQQQTRAKLVKLVGEDVRNANLEASLPHLPAVNFTTDISGDIANHPKVKMENAKVARSQYGVELAKQSYKPEWMLELAYGFRDGYNANGSERADFASAMISFDIPLFTKDRQDRQVAASQLSQQAASDGREEVIRQLTSDVEEAKATWLKLKERLERYKSNIIPQSKENASAALLAYQSRRGDFTSLMRASITELETSLKLTRLQTDLLKAQAKLLYLLGEQQ
jgi:outer membrane protein TolC